MDLGPGSAWTTWHYDAAGRLDVQDHHMGVAPQNLTFGYNPASQIVSRTGSNDGYAWTPPHSVSRDYHVNGLNQYTEALGTGAAAYLYDDNGNLRTDGSSSFLYDAENRMVSATGARNATLSYDPLGRLWQVTGTGGTTRFLYDGDRLVMELNGSGAVQRAYVHGPGADEPMVAYGPEGRRFLHTDHQGSIIAANDDSGNAVFVNSYDPWGVPGANNQGRFQYTGQAWLPELGMYYYKARIYWPTIGRFLQTDPIGYDDQINLYAYVGNDPLDHTDPTGNFHCVNNGNRTMTCTSNGTILDNALMAAYAAAWRVSMAIHNAMSGNGESNKSDPQSASSSSAAASPPPEDPDRREKAKERRARQQQEDRDRRADRTGGESDAGGAPRSAEAQNKQFRDVAVEHDLTWDEANRLHQAISKRNLSMGQIKELIHDMFGK